LRVKEKYLAIILLACLVWPSFAWARPTTEVEAQDAVRGWLTRDQEHLGARMGKRIARVKASKDRAGTVNYFVVNLDPGGFVIVSGDDLVEPIIAFAPQGTFDANPQNPLYILLQRDLPGRLHEVKIKEEQAQAHRRRFIPAGRQRRARNKWKSLQQSSATSLPNYAPSLPLSSGLLNVSDLRVAPLVQSKWNQGSEDPGTTNYCYNYYTNFDLLNPNYHYLTGCIATAMAQVMLYHGFAQLPVGELLFSISFTRIGNTRPIDRTVWLLGGDGNGGPYAWSNMPLDPNATTSVLERQAIGALTHDTGVAIQTSYKTSGSGAYNRNVPGALTGTFGYANAIFGANSIYNIPNGNLMNMLNPNLDASYPTMLGILDNTSIGHEVVVDGYGYLNATLYHHLNLGWSGTADAWYNLPTINAGSYDFVTVPECVYNIFPQGSGEIISGRVLDANGAPISGATVTAVASGGTNYTSTTNEHGIYALAKIPSASTYTITASQAGYKFFSQVVKTGTSTNNAVSSGNLWGIDFVRDLPGITLNQSLDNIRLAFTTGGDNVWSGQTDISYYGGSSARSGSINNGQSSWLQTTVVGPGTLSFYWKVSSEADFDFLELFVDDQLQEGSLSGEVDWQRKTFSIPKGSHIIRWVYTKDAGVSQGSDCGWVDNVQFMRRGIMPAIQLLLQQ
jgi:hypothetical protein